MRRCYHVTADPGTWGGRGSSPLPTRMASRRFVFFRRISSRGISPCGVASDSLYTFRLPPARHGIVHGLGLPRPSPLGPTLRRISFGFPVSLGQPIRPQPGLCPAAMPRPRDRSGELIYADTVSRRPRAHTLPRYRFTRLYNLLVQMLKVDVVFVVLGHDLSPFIFDFCPLRRRVRAVSVCNGRGSGNVMFGL